MFAAVYIALKFNMDGQNKNILSDTLREIVVDFGDLCRFCLTETKNGVSIHEKCFSKEPKMSESESAYEFISNFGIIEGKNLENFPLKMCEKCHELIKLFYEFSQICQKSDTLLRECYHSTLEETKTKETLNNGERSEMQMPVPGASNAVLEHSAGHERLNALSGGIRTVHLKLQESLSTCKGLIGGTMGVSLKKSEKASVPCSLCPLQFSNLKAFNLHYTETHNHSRSRTLLKFQCRKCRKSFSHPDRLKRHYRVNHRIPELELREDQLHNLVQHQALNEKANFLCFQCVPCKQFQTQDKLLEHLKDSHKMIQPLQKITSPLYSCAHCTYSTFVTRLSLNQHLVQVHRLKEDDITDDDVKCVSVLQKPATKVILCINPPAAEPQEKSEINSQGYSLISQQQLAFIDPAEDFMSPLYLNQHEGDSPENPTPEVPEEKSDDSWNCPECPASYSRKQSLHCHMKEKHNYLNPGATKCPECSETFLTNRRLIQHGISAHQKYFAHFHQVFRKVLQPGREEDDREKNFECDVCGRKYIYKTSLRKHILATHLGKKPKDAVTCPYCGKTLSNKLNLKSHIEFVHEALFVSCPICKKRINFRTIGRHYKTHKANTEGVFPGSNFLCNLCGKALKSKRSFEDHQKLHQNIRDEVCEVCGSGFTTKKLLRLHKKTHEGTARKLFACDQCEKVFSGRHTLNRHLLTHSGKKNFICEICSKCFYTIQELNRHVRYHKRDYKFDCQLCDMRFLCKSRFRHHMMKHRNIRPHKCQFCEKMFIERAKMNLHMATKHNVEVQNTKAVWKDPKTYVPLDDLL